MNQASNLSGWEPSDLSHRMAQLTGQTEAASQVQQLEAELWIERSLTRLSDRLGTWTTNLTQGKKNSSAFSGASLEAEIWQMVVAELRASLETGVVAIALPDGNLATSDQTGIYENSALTAQLFRVYYVDPYESQRQAKSTGLPHLLKGQKLKCRPGELITLADLQRLQTFKSPSAWPIADDQGVFGWLIVLATTSATSSAVNHVLSHVGLRTQWIERVTRQCAIAIRQVRHWQNCSVQHQKLEQRNRELVRANQLKSDFLANTSHEIRTPLSSILGFTHLLREQGYSPNNLRHQEYLRIILTSGQHLLALINDILDLSKIEANQLNLQWETVEVADLCRSVLTLVKEKAADKGLQLNLDLDSGVTTLIADPLRLKQMLFNLMANALKFTLRGSVGLQVQSAGIYLRFTVWDTGIGISQEKQSQLFRPYSQIENTAVARDEGTGLGLALTQKLAELHGGWVELHSELNQGSRFTVVLPLTPEVRVREAVDAAKAGSSNSATSLREVIQPDPAIDYQPGEDHSVQTAATAMEANKDCSVAVRPYHVLLVEDYPPNAKLMITYLNKLGYEVTWTKRAKEMWQALKRSQPALILMDIQLPDVDGLTLIQQLQTHEQYQGIPVIVQTAMAMTGDRETCLKAGATDYISKPIDLEALAQILCKYSDRSSGSNSRVNPRLRQAAINPNN